MRAAAVLAQRVVAHSSNIFAHWMANKSSIVVRCGLTLRTRSLCSANTFGIENPWETYCHSAAASVVVLVCTANCKMSDVFGSEKWPAHTVDSVKIYSVSQARLILPLWAIRPAIPRTPPWNLYTNPENKGEGSLLYISTQSSRV